MHAQVSRPVVFFTRYGKPSVRMAVGGAGAGSGRVGRAGAAAGAGGAEKRLKWGIKLRLDVAKPVAALAAHPTASQLLLLLDDGSLRCYGLTGAGLQMIWPAACILPGACVRAYIQTQALTHTHVHTPCVYVCACCPACCVRLWI